jgi:hypothetical protein
MPFKLKDILPVGGLFQKGSKTKNSAPKSTDSKKRASYMIKRTPKADVRYQIADISAAKTMATNPDRPDRSKLLAIYRYILTDAHLSSQISVSQMKVLSEPCFLYNAKGQINKETSKVLEQPWFTSLITYILETELYGYSLVECIADQATQSAEVILIPREHVSPDRHQVLIEGTLDGPVLPYTDVASKINLMEFQHTESLGLLLKAAPNVIFKFYARSDWSRASEKFGMPILKMTVNTNDESELDEAERKAANFGAEGYIVLQDGDDAEIIERKGQKTHEIYLENINYCDEQISKLINGQTGSSDQKAFVGAAEVQERVLNDYTTARMRAVKFAVNYQVIPFLIEKGFRFLNGMVFDYEQFRKAPATPVKEPDTPAQKKKLTRKVKLARTGDIASRIATEIFNHHRLSRETNTELFSETCDRLKSAVEEGFGGSIPKTAFGSPNQELLKNLTYNVGVFSSFKNHDMSKTLVMAMKDEDGNLKSFYQFRKDTAAIVGDYKIQHLQAEWNAALSNARSAANWQKAVENKDIYPNLKYTPSRSAHPRDSHRALWGTVRPVNDPFWDIYMPPSAWGCECGVTSTDEDATKLPDSLPEVSPLFANNPGKTGKVFNNEHPYYKLEGEEFTRVANEAKAALFSYTRKEITTWGMNEYLKETPAGRRNIFKVPYQDTTISAVVSKRSFKEILAHHTDSPEYWDRINALYNIDEIVKSARFLHDEAPLHANPSVKRFLTYRSAIEEKIMELKFRETTDGVYLYYIKLLK